MMERPVIVIFGAAVMADGRASPALSRRIGYGLDAAGRWPDAMVLCSGAAGGARPSEASIMRAVLLERGIRQERMALDEASRDTLQSVVAVARFVRRQGLDGAIICSDRYHLPRILLMLAVLGVAARTAPIPADASPAPLGHRLRMHLREALAIPYELAIVIARRRSLLAQVAAAGRAIQP